MCRVPGWTKKVLFETNPLPLNKSYTKFHNIKDDDFKLNHPLCCLLAAPSRGEKTSVCIEILCRLNRYYSKPNIKIINNYKNDKESYNLIRDCETLSVFLTSINLVDTNIVENSIIFFDDCLLDIERDY